MNNTKNTKKGEIRQIVNFYELSPEWQKEAKSNSEYAEDQYYLKPKNTEKPEDNILISLETAMQQKGEYNGFIYNAYIVISNCFSYLLNISDDFEQAEFIIAG